MSVLDKVYKIVYGSVYWPLPVATATATATPEEEHRVYYVTPDFLLMNVRTMHNILREDYTNSYNNFGDLSVRPTVMGVQVLSDYHLPEGEVLGLVKTTRA